MDGARSFERGDQVWWGTHRCFVAMLRHGARGVMLVPEQRWTPGFPASLRDMIPADVSDLVWISPVMGHVVWTLGKT